MRSPQLVAFRGWLALLVFAGACRVCAPAPADGQTLDSGFWVPDGPVLAQVVSDQTLYIGGSFGYVGPYQGGAVPLSTTTGAVLASFPPINGPVHCILPDGAGGFYLGGEFDSVGGTIRRNLARIHADLSLDPWDPGPNGAVHALVQDDTTLFVGGSFDSIGGMRRTFVAALERTTGALRAWDPGPISTLSVADPASVRALALLGPDLYMGGTFTHVGGQFRLYVARLDATTANCPNWVPFPDNWIYSLAARDTTIYLGGVFTQIGGVPRRGLGAVGQRGGNPMAWNPDPFDTTQAAVHTLLLHGQTLYVQGHFQRMGGQPRFGLAAVDPVTGAVSLWNPQADQYVTGMTVRDSTIYASGSFDQIGGAPHPSFAALDSATATARPWTAESRGPATALGLAGETLYAGGPVVLTSWLKRNAAAAFDLTTGIPTQWDPNVHGVVSALAVGAGLIYMGGDFELIGGVVRTRVGAANPTTGAVATWHPGADRRVETLVVQGPLVYAGGQYHFAGSQSRARLAALDATSGLSNSWNPGVVGFEVSDLEIGGSSIYAGGDFTSVGGMDRRGLAAIDATSGIVSSWNPNPVGIVHDLALSGTTLYTAGEFSTIAGQTRKNLAALTTDTGAAKQWNPTPNGAVRALAVGPDGATVFAGGAFTTIGGEPRKRIAVLDTTMGLALPWTADANGTVENLSVSGSKILVGGRFARMAGQGRPYLASLRLSGIVAVDPAPTPAASVRFSAQNPMRSRGTVTFELPRAASVRLTFVDVTGRVVRSVLDQEALAAGEHRVKVEVGGLPAGVYFLRLEFAGVRVSRKVMILR